MIGIAIIIALCAITITLVNNFSSIKRFIRIRKQLKKFPSPAGHWFYGNLLDIQSPENILNFVGHYSAVYPSSYVVNLGLMAPVLICNTPAAARTVIAAGGIKGNFSYSFIQDWLGKGLLVSNGARWSRNRKLITPAFHFGILKHYISIYNQCVDVLLEKWSSHASSGEYFEEYSDMNSCTFDIILQSSFSVKTQCQTVGKNHPYIKSVKELAYLTVNRFFSISGYIPFLYPITSEGRKFFSTVKKSRHFTEDVIRKRMQEIKSNSDSHDRDYVDFLDILLRAKDQDGNGLSFTDIRNEVDTFMFAGHDTTSSALSFSVYLLGKHKDHQRKVREEVESVLHGRTEVTWDDLSELKYTTMCIKEALRMYSTVPIIERQLDKDITIDDITVPAGAMVNIPIFALHDKKDAWLDHEEYNPLRFMTTEATDRDTFSFIPFSAGSRNCIGQSFAMNVLRVAVAKIFQRYNVDIDETKPVVRCVPLVMKSTNGLWIKVNER